MKSYTDQDIKAKKGASRVLSRDEARRRRGQDEEAPTPYPGWEHTITPTLPRPKKRVTMRLDADVYDWFTEGGRGYQTRINAVLRAYYEAHKNSLRPQS